MTLNDVHSGIKLQALETILKNIGLEMSRFKPAFMVCASAREILLVPYDYKILEIK